MINGPSNSARRRSSSPHASTDDRSHDSPPRPSAPTAPRHTRSLKKVPLKRNEACVECRRRRIKCDAGHPCTPCIKHFEYNRRVQPELIVGLDGPECVYQPVVHGSEEDGDEEPARPEMLNTDGDLHGMMRTLVDRVSTVESALSSLASYIQSQPPNQPPTSTIPVRNPAPAPGPSREASTMMPALESYAPMTSGPSWSVPWLEDRHNGTAVSSATGVDMPFSSALAAQPLATTHPDTSQDMDLLFSGWPPSLPTPEVLYHLVVTFFSTVPATAHLLHRSTFLSRLSFSPLHPNFPHPALLHAICALSARFSAAVETEPITAGLARRTEESSLPLSSPIALSSEPDGPPPTCFAEKHARLALVSMKYERAKERQLLEICQAQVVLHAYYQLLAQWHNNWLMAGQSARWALFLGIFRDQQDEAANPGDLRASVLPPPDQDWDREERRRLMYQILINDIVTSSGSNWPVALNADELTVNLPAARADFECSTTIPENPQNVRSSDLYSSHPVVDSFVLHVKAAALLGQVSELRRRLRTLNHEARVAFPGTAGFRNAVGAYNAFVAGYPPSLRDVTAVQDGGAKIDSDNISAQTIMHAAAIMLAEPFADPRNPTCPYTALIWSAARAIVNIAHALENGTVDISTCVTPIAALWFHSAARVLALCYQQAISAGDQTIASQTITDLEALKLVLLRMSAKSTIATLRYQMVVAMLDRFHQELFGSLYQPIAPTAQSSEVDSPPRMWSLHPETMVWSRPAVSSPNGGGNINTFRDILDQQRAYVWRPRSASQAVIEMPNSKGF